MIIFALISGGSFLTFSNGIIAAAGTGTGNVGFHVWNYPSLRRKVHFIQVAMEQ